MPSNQEILDEMQSQSKLNQARRILVNATAQIEQGQAQRVPLSIFEVRAMEFDAVIKIATVLGVPLEYGETQSSNARA
jgi:hypothetical protein